MSGMKDQWFDNYYSEWEYMADSIERGLNGSRDKKNKYSGDSVYNKPINGFGNDCDCCEDESITNRTDNNYKENSAGLTKEDYFRFDLYNIQDELAEIMMTKHDDYGPTNISKSPGGALNGIRVRMHDKLARLNNLVDNNKEPKHESIRDTLIDIANYATIAIMVIDDKWDK